MAAGYLVIKAPIKSLVQQSDGCLLAYRTRWSAWYGPPHSFPHICAGNYSLDVKYPQMSHLKRGYMLPAHFEGNHLPPPSSFPRNGQRVSDGTIRAREVDKEQEGGNIDLKWLRSSEEEKSRGQGENCFFSPSVSLCGPHIISNPNLHTCHGM